MGVESTGRTVLRFDSVSGGSFQTISLLSLPWLL